MKFLVIPQAEIQGPFVTPPEFQGQALERSYACTDDYILERRIDRIECRTSIRAYGFGASLFEPQNQNPDLGEFIGPVAIKP